MRNFIITVILVSLATGCFPKKKHSGGNGPLADPVYTKELTIDSKIDSSYVFKSEYVLPAQSRPDPDYSVDILDLNGVKLDRALLGDFQSYSALPRPDGLNDVKILVPFRITNQSLSGFKIRVTVASRLDESGIPTVMETKVNVAKGFYLAPHHKKDSPFKNTAVLTESVFKVRADSGLVNLVERALSGEEGADNEAESDLMNVRAALEIAAGVIVQKADAVLSVTTRLPLRSGVASGPLAQPSATRTLATMSPMFSYLR